MAQTERKSTIEHIYASLVERGYRPVDQLVGYILTGDPTYITNHNGARQLIAEIDPHELLCEVLLDYFSAERPA